MARVHVTYEVERLVLLLPIQAQVAPWAHPIITQSLLEAFLVHLRALADFVATPAKQRFRLDVAAEDYYDGTWPAQPEVIFGTDRQEHDACMDELHRRLAHISVHRVTSGDDFLWSRAMTEWQPALLAALRQFIAGLPPPRREWFAAAEYLLGREP